MLVRSIFEINAYTYPNRVYREFGMLTLEVLAYEGFISTWRAITGLKTSSF